MPQTITPQEARRRIASGAILIDIRDPDEYARAHIPCAHNLPLARIGSLGEVDQGAPEVIFHCKSGMRTAANAEALAAATEAPVYLLEGGLDAWRKAGLDCAVDRRQPLEIMRQVQIVAGALILIGVLLGFALDPLFFGLAGFVGAGLLVAGTTGWCGMARLLAVMPWNRRPAH